MVICIVALLVFSFLSITSARYRPLAKDAFKCVFRMIQFKPCEVQLEEKIKSKVTAKLMKVPMLARFFYRHFKPLSWIFTIAFFASMFYSGYGIYNLAIYGSCEPGSAACGINQFLQIIACYETQIVFGIIIFGIIFFAYFMVKKKNIKFVFK